jgi:hypothetical protein
MGSTLCEEPWIGGRLLRACRVFEQCIEKEDFYADLQEGCG